MEDDFELVEFEMVESVVEDGSEVLAEVQDRLQERQRESDKRVAEHRLEHLKQEQSRIEDELKKLGVSK